MPGIKEEPNDSELEYGDQETPESEKSSQNESDSGSYGSGSGDDGDSSEMDEEECERRRTECLYDMADLERQFSILREQLYRERMTQVDYKLDEVRIFRAMEYLQPLEDLQENMKMRIEVAGILRELRIANIKNKYEAEILASKQNYTNEKLLLSDNLQNELEEKIRRLEEDRHNIDITSDLLNEQVKMKKSRRKTDPLNPERRKRPVTVSDILFLRAKTLKCGPTTKPLTFSSPYIVYMLKEEDILEDWTIIKRALKVTKRKCERYKLWCKPAKIKS